MYTSTSGHTTPDNITLRAGQVSDLPATLPLLVAYRHFYGLDSDTDALASYIAVRLQQQQAALWLALQHDQVIAFALCYHGHSTLTLNRNELLHDLYVTPAYRRQGIAARLLQHIQQHLPAGAGLWLETARDNLAAQALYRQLGFVQETAFMTMAWQKTGEL